MLIEWEIEVFVFLLCGFLCFEIVGFFEIFCYIVVIYIGKIYEKFEILSCSEVVIFVECVGLV